MKDIQKTFRTLWPCCLSVLIASGWAGIARTQEPDEPAKVESQTAVDNPQSEIPNPQSADPQSAEAELIERWEYYSTLQIPALPMNGERSAAPPHVDLILNPQIFSRSRSDLADLRLYDAAQQPIPYALRILRPESVRAEVPVTEFNRSEPENGPHELTLELVQTDVDHNEVQIETSGAEFRRAVEVDGSEEGKEWRKLAAGNLIKFSHGEQKVERISFAYPVSRLRFVRVRIHPDPQRRTADNEPDKFHLNAVKILRQVELPGERFVADGKLGAREPVRVYGVPGSSWIIDLGGDNVPCDRIEVDVADAEFARDITLEAEYPYGRLGQPTFNEVYLEKDRLWQRQPGTAKKPLVATFGEVQTRRLRLRISDHRNPPLTIRSVKFSASARQVIFARPAQPDSQAASDLRLYFGNPRAETPLYDFARNLPAKLDAPPQRVAPSDFERNPNFTPPPLPFTERFPWLIYVVLGGVTAILAIVILSLARSVIADHDADQSQPLAV